MYYASKGMSVDHGLIKASGPPVFLSMMPGDVESSGSTQNSSIPIRRLVDG